MGKKSKNKMRSKGDKGTLKINKKTKTKKIWKGKKKLNSNKVDPNQLKEAVFALGGDDEDLKLINEEEVEDKNDSSQGADFSSEARKELNDFIRSLGLDEKFAQGMPAEEDEAEIEEEADDDEESEEEEEDPEQADSDDGDNNMELQVEEVSSTSADKENPEVKEEKSNFQFIKEVPHRKHCVVKSGQKWHEMFPVDDDQDQNINSYWIGKLEKYTKTIFDSEIENYQKNLKNSKDSEITYINTILKSGALNDKISAYTVLIQNSPVHNLRALESLIGMVSLKSRRPCMLALDCLKEVFVSDLLAPDRKLLNFEEHDFSNLQKLSGGNKDTRDKYLIVCLYEHKLKEAYKAFLTAIDEVAKDTIDKTKIKTMSVILDLLIANPELEQELLSRLVNKLGDPQRSIAAKAMYQLGKLLEEHPAMKLVVLKEVERVLYRPNVSSKAQYYGICFLSQILLERDEDDLATRLIQIYFSFFKANVKKGDIDTKLMSALLTGVNRAFPYAKMAREKLDAQTKVIYRLVQMTNFNTSVQALTLLYQIMDSGDSVSDRFYGSLYRKLGHPDFASSTKQAIFLNIIFKSMKKDSSVNRVMAFIKRLLQVCLFFSPQLICGILFLISELVKTRTDLNLRQFLVSSAEVKYGKFDDEDEDEEHYKDIKTEEDDDVEESEQDEEKPVPTERSTWLHKNSVKSRTGTSSYDPFHRNPAFCGAEKSILMELEDLSQHFHPSVALFAQNLVEGTTIRYSGNPLQDFTLIRFLDRFVFRNPKKDPLKGKPTSVLSKRNLYQPKGVKALAPDSKEFVNREESSIPKDELFIFKYFKEKRAKMPDDVDSDAESVNSEDFNEYLDSLAGKTDDDIDFANNVTQLKEDDDDDAMEEDEEDQEEDSDVSGYEEELDGDEDDMFQDIEEMASEDEPEEETFLKETAKNKKKKRGNVGSTGNKLDNLLASAEEFTDLVDECTINDIDVGGSGSLSNVKDKASKKQLNWETNRNEKLSGKNWKQQKKSFKAKKWRK